MSTSYWLLKRKNSKNDVTLYVRALESKVAPSGRRGRPLLDWTSHPEFAIWFPTRVVAEIFLNVARHLEARGADEDWTATEHSVVSTDIGASK